MICLWCDNATIIIFVQGIYINDFNTDIHLVYYKIMLFLKIDILSNALAQAASLLTAI